MKKHLVAVVMFLFLLSLAVVGQNDKTRGGFDKTNLDETCQPCKDFYRYANGGWLSRNPIPPAYSRWGQFYILMEANSDKLRSILETAAANPRAPEGSNEKKLGDLYATYLDEQAIEAAGLKPIQPLLEKIAAIKDTAGLGATFGWLHTQGMMVGFSFSSSSDVNNSRIYAAYASQGGLGLPDRDFYFKDDEKSKQTRVEYVHHIARMFELAGDAQDQAQTKASAVMVLETRLAEASMGSAQMRDPQATTNRKSLAELKSLTVNFHWEGYLKQIGHPEVKEVIVRQPAFFQALDREMAASSISDWKIYLRWHVLNRLASALPARFDREDFNFNQQYLTGSKEQLPRWRRGVTWVGNLMPDALGAEYVRRYFPPESRKRMLALVDNLRVVLRDDITHLDWMGGGTRQEAIKKLEALKVRVGYPDKWRDYAALTTGRSSYAENFMSALQFSLRKNWDKIGLPVDLGEWQFPAWLVDAFAGINAVTFPAGILQPPFFDAAADDAINYGAIGAVIGHEITHHFDDSGRRFDAQGNLRDWWTPEDAKNYAARAACVEKQYSGYQVAGGLFHNGKLVLGEAISDLGGLKLAYLAYKKSLGGKAQPPSIGGFTGEQRFFLSFAQIWAGSERPEAERLRVQTDPHALARFRVNGTLSNMPEFAAAFGCKKDDAMVRDEKCGVW